MWCIASGDDTVAWVKTERMSVLETQINRLTTTDKDFIGPVGLGQIVVDRRIGAWWDTDFCSKWFYLDGPSTLENWRCTRDYKKTFATKMCYTGSSAIMLLEPLIHARAILGGIMAETDSRLIRSLCEYRIQWLEKTTPIQKNEHLTNLSIQFDEWYKLRREAEYKNDQFDDSKDSVCKDRYDLHIMRKLGLSLSSLITLAETGQLHFTKQ